MLKKKAYVYQEAYRFFKGGEAEREDARENLIDLGLPTARFLVALAERIVPKAERPAPDPEQIEPPLTHEDRALEVIIDIQEGFLRRGDITALMTFLAVATGQIIELDSLLDGKKKTFHVHRVHPRAALGRVSGDLGCDEDALDLYAPVVEIFFPMMIDMKIHGEEVGWLLQAMASQGGFKVELDPAVKGTARFRVRAATYKDAFLQIAKRSGFVVKEIDGGYRVSK
jgi:hypothetical protein